MSGAEDKHEIRDSEPGLSFNSYMDQSGNKQTTKYFLTSGSGKDLKQSV